MRLPFNLWFSIVRTSSKNYFFAKAALPSTVIRRPDRSPTPSTTNPSSDTPKELAQPAHPPTSPSLSSPHVTAKFALPDSLTPELAQAMVPCLFPPLVCARLRQLLTGLANRQPASWTVEEVVAFFSSIPDCAVHARKFQIHLIDGEAMFLLKMRHLVKIMKIKLGPALKIYSIIDVLRSPLQCPCAHHAST